MNRDLEAEWAAESAEIRRAEIERLTRIIAHMSPANQTHATALALTMKKLRLQRAEREQEES